MLGSVKTNLNEQNNYSDELLYTFCITQAKLYVVSTLLNY